MHSFKPIECTTPKVNPKENFGDYDCRYRFIHSKNCTIIVSDIDNGGHYAFVEAGLLGNLCIFLLELL